MAQNSNAAVDVISRHNGEVISHVSGSSQTVNLSQSSIIRINGARSAVSSYERVGNDLIIHMQDGSTVRYQSFFDVDAKGKHSELIFDDGVNPIEHATFVDAGAAPATAVPIVPGYETISGIDSLIVDTSSFNPAVLASILGVVALGAGIGIAASNRGGSHHDDNNNNNNNNPPNGEGGSGGIASVAVSTFAGDNVLNASEITTSQVISGYTSNIAAGQILTLTLNGKTYTTAINADGTWSITLPAADLQALSDGTYVVSVSVPSGTGQTATNTVTIGVDATTPQNASDITLVDSNHQPITGSTNDPSPTLSGKAEPGSTVTVKDGNTTIGSVTVGGDGNWSFTPTAPLGEGSHSITVVVTDPSGNSSAPSTPIVVNIDTQAPEAATGVTLTDSSGQPVTGPTNDPTPTVSGKAEPGSTVTVKDGNTTIGSVTVGGDGNWSFTPSTPLGDGSHSITVVVTDPAGNSSAPSTPIVVNIDATAPEAATGITLTNSAGDTITTGATNDTTPTIGGKAEAGSTVTIKDGGTTLGTVTAGSDGSWSFTPTTPLGEGNHSITVVVTDPSGNSSAPSTPIVVNIDTQAPEAATGVTLTDSSGQPVTGPTNDPTPTVSGKAEPGSTVTVKDGNTTIGSVTVGGDGNWSFTPGTPLGDGSHSITVVVTDPAGNSSAPSTPVVVNIDATAPEAATGITLTNSAGDTITTGATNDTTPTIGGKAEAGSTVTIKDGSTTLGTVTAGSDGSWSFTPTAPLGEGSHSISVVVTDPAGNSSAPSAPIVVNIDTQAPEAATGITFTNAAGETITTGATNDTTPTINGKAEAGSTVTIKDGNTTLGSVTVGSDGSWSFTPTAPLNEGNHSISVVVTDPAGNSSLPSVPAIVDIDTSAPEAATGVTLTDSAGQPIVGPTNNPTPTVSGKAEVGSTVTVKDGSTTIGSVTVGNDGNWSFTPSTPLGDGSHSITVVVTDPAGNSSAPSTPIVVNIDATAPEVATGITFTNAAGETITTGATNDTTPTISGKAEAGSTVTIKDGDAILGTVNAGDDGSWSFTPSAPLGEGDHSISVIVTDEAGNNSAPSSPITLDIDTKAPEIAADVTLTNSSGSVIGSATNDTTPTISGKAEANSTVTIKDGDTTLGSVTVGSDGSWSFTPTAPLDNGNHSISVVVTDPAGNNSLPSAPIAVLINTIAPEAATGVTLTNSAGDEITGATNDTTPTVSGKATVGDTITIKDGDVILGRIVVSGDGSWSFTPDAPLKEGSHSISVVVTDTAGNDSVPSTAIVINVDTTVPELATDIAFTNGAGEPIGGVTNDTNLTISGKAEADSTVTIKNGNDTLGSVKVGSDGSWSFTPSTPLTEGNYNISVVVSDAAGNSSEPSAPIVLVIDLTAPGVATDITFTNAAGDIVPPGATNSTTPTISGKAEVGSTVTVTIKVGDNTLTENVLVGPDQSWSFTPTTPLAEGSYSVSIVVTDPAGNNSPTTTVTLIVDTTPPTLNVDLLTGDGYINLAESQAPINITGKASTSEAGLEVKVTLNGQEYTAVVKPDGSWTANIPADALTGLKGDYPLVATLTDAAGNTTTTTSSVHLSADPQSLPGITINDFAGGNGVDGAEAVTAQELTGNTTNVEAGQLVTITLNGDNYTAIVQKDGSWSVIIPADAMQALANGSTQTILVSVADKAGNPPATSREDFAVDTTKDGISIDPVTGDNKITFAETQAGITISGSTHGVSDTSRVTINFGGKQFFAIVSGGRWSVDLTSAELADLTLGNKELSVSVVDSITGTELTNSIDVGVFNTLPTPTLNQPFGDGILNIAEAAIPQLLSGGTGVIGAGQTVQVSLGNKQYEATVDNNGFWTVKIPSADLQALPAGTIIVTIIATDAEGNSSAINSSATVNFTAPLPTIVLPFADDKVGIDAAAGVQTLSGTTGETGAGQHVTVTLNGKTYNATVAADGSWTLGLSPGDLQALPEGNNAIKVVASDAAGNTTTITKNISVDFTAPTLTVNPIAGDGIVSRAESLAAIDVTGKASLSEAGQQVSVTINSKTYTGTVNADGSWTVTIPANSLSTVANGTYPLTVSLTDSAGNTTTQTSNVVVKANVANLPTIAVDDFASDNIVDGAERTVSQTLSGKTTNVEAGQTVTINIGSLTYNATVDSAGNWQVQISAQDLQKLADGAQSINVSVVDKAGNSISNSLDFTLNSQQSGLAFDLISGDGKINAQEAAAGVVISGTSVNIAQGTTVDIAFNGKTYTAIVDGTGHWAATIPAADLAAGTLASGLATLSVTATDTAGKTIVNTTQVGVFNENLIAPTVDPAFGNGLLNKVEAGSPQILTGSTGVSGAGQSVSVTLNGKTYTATVDDKGNWSATLPSADLLALPEGTLPITVTATDAAGNSQTNGLAGNVSVDFTPPLLTVNPIAGDGIINNSEAQAAIDITGKSSPDEAGKFITVNLNGKNYTGEVQADGSWTVTVPAGELSGQPNGAYPITISLTDTAGNTTTLTQNVTLSADGSTLPSISINVFAHDNVLDGAERQVAQTLSGKTSNVEPGQQVEITIGSGKYTAIVQADGSWSVQIPAAALQALSDGSNSISVSISDKAGNSANASENFSVNSTQSGLSFDVIAGDGNLNVSEAAAGITVSGTSYNVPVGSTVVVNVGGENFNATVGANGSWSVQIPSLALTALPDGPNVISVSSADTAGKPISNSTELGVYTHNLPDPTLNQPFGDGTLNIKDAASDQVITGSTGVAGNGQTVTLVIGGITLNATVAADGSWRATLPANSLSGLTGESLDISITATDAAGNTKNSTVTAAIDLVAPTLEVKPITGDDIINRSEATDGFAITGTASLSEAGRTVTVDVAGKTFSGTVQADGTWSINVPAGALSTLLDGHQQLTVSLTDAAGNNTTVTHSFDAAIQIVPQPTISTPFGDGSLNKEDAATNQTLSGDTGVIGANQVVTVTLGDGTTPLTATVDDNGHWSLNLTAEQLGALKDGSLTITITATDTAGNSTTTSSAITVDLTPPVLADLTVSGDNVINAAESRAEVEITGNSSAEDAGQTVTVTFTYNGTTQTFTSIVLEDGRWSVGLPASLVQTLPDASYTYSVSLKDVAGNTTTAEGSFSVKASPTSLPTLTIDKVTGDDYINALEKAGAITLTGSTTNVEDGQTVNVLFNNKAYTATVTGGKWSVTVDAQDVAALPDGQIVVSGTVTDAAQNPAAAGHNVTVIASPADLPTLTVNPVSDDDKINAIEHELPLTISGSSTHLVEGQLVKVTLNNVDYSATIDAQGNWTVTVPADAVQQLPQGDNTITVSSSDIANNPANATHHIQVDSLAPEVTLVLDASVADGLNLSEAQSGLALHGVTEAGLTVNITFNGVTYSTVADAQGNWNYTLSKDALLAVTTDGTQTIGVSVLDGFGNPGSISETFTLAVNALPIVSIDPISGDNIIGVKEATDGFVISGTAVNLDGQTITVNLGALQSFTVVVTDGKWSVNVPPALLTVGLDSTVTIDVTAKDAFGNDTTNSSALELHLAPLTPPTANDLVFGDNLLNVVESGQDQQIGGLTNLSGPGVKISISILGGDGTPIAATVSADGKSWTATLPSTVLQGLSDGKNTILITSEDVAGNIVTGTKDFTAYVHNVPSLSEVDTSFGTVLNINAAAQGGTLSGTTGATTEGQIVTVNINGSQFAATVNDIGQWTLTFTPEQLQALPDGTWSVVVKASDAAGNTSTAPAINIAVHLTPPASPTIDKPFVDGVLNNAEAAAAEGQTLTGSTGLLGANQSVKVTIDGVTTPIAVTVDANGLWTAQLTTAQLAQVSGTGAHNITVTTTDQYGNESVATTTGFTSATILPVPTIDANPFGDGFVSSVEANGALTITGKTGVVGISSSVKLTIDVNGISYSGSVNTTDGTWSVTLPAGALSGLGDASTHNINVTVTDANGNTGTAVPVQFVTDFSPPVLAVTTVFGDPTTGTIYLNQKESQLGTTISGTVTDAVSVSVKLGNGDPITVAVTGNTWSVDLTPAQLAALNQGQQTVTVTATDNHGNVTTNSLQVNVVTNPSIKVGLFAGDDNLNYGESLVPQTISGTSSGLAVGQQINVTAGSFTGTATVVAGGGWSISVPAASLATFNNSTQISVTATDAAGNVVTDNHPITVNLTPPTGPFLTIDPISGDNVVNASDPLIGNLTVTGHFSGTTPATLFASQTITLRIDGVIFGTYPILVSTSGTWQIIAAVPVALLSDGTRTFTATLETLLPIPGQPITSASETVLVDRTPPVVTIDTFAGDNILNAAEAAAGQTISGKALGETGRTVTVQIDGKNSYYAVVDAQGNWSVAIPAADLTALKDGAHTISASMTDAAGNPSAPVSLTFNAHETAPLLTVGLDAGNNVFNLVGLLAGTLLGGTAPDQAGQTVTIKLLGVTIGTAVVGPTGLWSTTIKILPNDLDGLLALAKDGANVLDVSITDGYGNTTRVNAGIDLQFNQLLKLDISEGLGLNKVLNAAGSLLTQTIGGTAEHAGVGSTVTLKGLGLTPLTTTVGADGKWSINILPGLLSGLLDGPLGLTLTLTDAFGNTKTSGLTVDVAKTLPVVGIVDNLIGGVGNVLNAVSVGAAQTISGAINAADGSKVSVAIGGKIFDGGVVNGGKFSLTIPEGGLTGIADGLVPMVLNVVDTAGNAISQTLGNLNVVVNSLPGLVKDTLSVVGDGLITAADLLTNQLITGTVKNMAAGTKVAIQIGNGSLLDATVDSSGHFSLTLTPAVLTGLIGGLLTGNLNVSIIVTDAAGNVDKTTSSLGFNLVAPVIKLDSIFDNGHLNASDLLSAQTITGLVTGVVSGTKVTVTLNGKNYIGTTSDDAGHFSITVQPSDLKLLVDGVLNVTASVANAVGNVGSIISPINVITTLPKVVLDGLFGKDGALNAVTAGVDQVLTGTLSNFTAGSTVNVSIGNLLLPAVVDATGKFTATLSVAQMAGLGDGKLNVNVVVTDLAGNTSSASSPLNVIINAIPKVSITSLFSNGVLGVADLLSPQTISGTSVNLSAGSKVSVSLGSKSYQGTVDANGNWSVTVGIGDLKLLTTDGNLSVGVSYTDSAGNQALGSSLLNVIANALPTITLDGAFNNGLLNAVGALLTQTITGTTTNAVGSTVTINLGVAKVTAQVKADGTFSAAVSPSILALLTDGHLQIGASVTNSAGKTAEASVLDVQVGIHTLPTLNIGSLFSNTGYLNAADASKNGVISGTSNIDNGTATVTLNGTTYTGTIVKGVWSVNIGSTALKAIGDGVTSVNVKLADAVGNVTSQNVPLTVKTHALPIATLDGLGNLGNLIGGILGNGLTLSGKSRNIEAGGLIKVTLLGNTLLGTVQADGSWTVKFSSQVFKAYSLFTLLGALLGDIVELQVQDKAGNGFDIHLGLSSGSTLPPETASFSAAHVAPEDNHTLAATTHHAAEPATVQNHVATTDTEHDIATATAASTLTDTLITPESTIDHQPADAGHAEPIETAFSIGGVTLELTEHNGEAIGGAGNDIIEVFDLNFAHIDGGAGVDTLLLAGNNQHLDLTLLGLKVEHIDIFDLGNTGTNSISLNLEEAQTVKDKPSDEVIIKGAEGSLVNLVQGSDGAWNETGQRTVDGLTFDVYHNSSLDANNTLGDVLVQHGIHVQNT